VGEVVEFLKDPKKFQKIGGRIPKGILMVGPPGTGKTLLAKAIAGEADVPFFSISGSDFVEMFVGVGASRVRDMFEQGRKNAPCLIFIDEIDAVGRQRGAGLGGGNDEREQTLNSLLVEMDGFDTQEGVIIIAATNRPDVLDSALLRPGRFDRQVYIDLPDIVGREQVLRVHARKIALSDNVDLAIIARGTPGLSGAELANLLNEAALLAARRNKKKVEMADIDEARDKVLWGRERRRVMDDAEKRLVAWHEAGHAIVQAVLDDGTVPVHKVTIIPRGQSLGSTTYLPTKDILTRPKKKLLDEIAMAMGGRIAEKLVTGDISNGAYGDIKQATRIARAMVCDYGMSDLGPVALGENQDTVFLGRDITRSQHVSEDTARRIDVAVSEILNSQYQRAEQIIGEHRAALDKVAQALLEHETIEGKHVIEILREGEIKSPVVAVKPPKLPPAGTGKTADKATPDAESGPAGAPAPSPA
jgi:cell division protease FtsH